jgi:hypothetical protein
MSPRWDVRVKKNKNAVIVHTGNDFHLIVECYYCGHTFPQDKKRKIKKTKHRALTCISSIIVGGERYCPINWYNWDVDTLRNSKGQMPPRWVEKIIPHEKPNCTIFTLLLCISSSYCFLVLNYSYKSTLYMNDVFWLGDKRGIVLSLLSFFPSNTPSRFLVLRESMSAIVTLHN